jgi:hypothetical protein
MTTTEKGQQLHNWMCRVRRDILLIEKYLGDNYIDWRKGQKFGKEEVGVDLHESDQGQQQTADNSKKVAAAILAEWEIANLPPADPGEPPPPPFL